MVRAFRHILLVLVAFAVVGGTTSEFALSAAHGTVAAMTDAPCNMAMPDQASGGGTMPMPPCKGMTSDCIKQMGCVTVVGLPAYFHTHETVVQYGTVDFWLPPSKLESLDLAPEPQPPRTA
jgi:hypothetical protein